MGADVTLALPAGLNRAFEIPPGSGKKTYVYGLMNKMH